MGLCDARANLMDLFHPTHLSGPVPALAGNGGHYWADDPRSTKLYIAEREMLMDEVGQGASWGGAFLVRLHCVL
jgi:hypothetical protein